ncbi:MAG: PVC-type heme-binding CxxCH protein [Planctomycetota bacterium]
MQLTRSSLVFMLGLASAAVSVPTAVQAQAKPKFDSKIVSTATSGHAVNIDVDITGAKSLFLVAQDGGDGYACDWADWIEPQLIGPKGTVKLTDLKWKSAVAGFGEVHVNANCVGKPLKVAGKSVEFGIGTHANSIVEYVLPEGSAFTKFTAKGGLDEGGTNQGNGSTVQFFVFTDKPDAKYLAADGGGAGGVGSRDPLDAVKGLDVADGLEATLFASEASGMLSPSDIDVDHLGRVWVCEVVNYRHRSGERKEGDRILVVEDTNGDGVSDKQTVFFQGHEVDSALGIGVFPTPSGKGTKIIVSCAPNVWIFTDEDGDLKADKKELLFTNVGQPQHDHSTHAFIFGPDGKLYWNVGNTGKQVCDAAGKPIVDLAGNVVNDSGKPYRQGMAFRCNVDGSQFEVLGNNFRNNYEVTVDSFGTVWQSDNDDDGNKGVRINYVMEFGNFGYVDEITGASWNAPRTNLEAEIPLRHWHLNDPGVVPNLVQTGAGSPTGICFYEGTLLPEIFRNQPIHCDAGPNVVRAYPTKKSGAGYSAEIVNILNGARDNWFRPSDVCVAPDGSLIVADWYDPGVGGHRMGDADKGRLFRVAPPKTAYQANPIDVSTVEGAIAALKSPNLAARYMGWTALHEMGDKAEAGLLKVFQEETNPRLRARAFWLLSKLKAKGLVHVSEALRDKDSDIRIAAIRAGRQLVHSGAGNVQIETSIGEKRLSVSFEEMVIRSQLEEVLTDNPLSPQVLREVAIALRHSKSSSKPLYWAELASRHDGQDRWYLEALGIGAGDDWDTCLAAWLKEVGGNWNTPAGRDIIWRSRAKQSPGLLAKIIAATETTAEQCPRYLRAFDFLTGSEKEDALVQLAFATTGDEKKVQFVTAEALSRLKGFDVTKNEQQKVALNRVLESLQGQPQFLVLVEKFSVADRYPDLAQLASAKPDDQLGIDAVRILLAKQQLRLLETILKGSQAQGNLAVGLATALSNSGDAQVVPSLLALVQNADAPADLRRQSIKGATRTKAGAAEVLKLAEAKAFDDTFAPALSAALQSAPLDAAQKASFEKLFPSPAGKDAKPLPSLGELAQLKGNAENGAKIYATTGKCATCHIVNNQGKEVGPNLSEIGSKLSRQAMFESIIFPSAGISHNYETFSAIMLDGTIFNGILVSQTDEAVTLRNNEAITKTVARKDLDELVKQKLSLMPADLAKLLSVSELADVVEYLATLKKK